MQGNSNFERKARKERNERPPRGSDSVERQQEAKRGKSWTREDKRGHWEEAPTFNAFQ